MWKVCKWCLQELLGELTKSRSSAFGLVSPANEDYVCMWKTDGKLIIICKVGKYGGSASNEWEVDCHWKVKGINCFHTWIPKGMGYVGSDDVGNIHKVQVCTLMKYYPDQAVGSRKMVSRHTKRIAKVTMDPEVKCMVWKCGLCRGSYDSSFWSW